MATIETSDILLVGSVPEKSETVEGVFHLCNEKVGSRLFALPDGELGQRRMWIGMLGESTFANHPDIEASDVAAPFGAYRLKPGVESISLAGHLPYADAALASFEVFRRMQDEGELPSDIRFQVSIPTPHAAVGGYFTDTAEWPIVQAAFGVAVGADIERMVAQIPAEKLAIQWDYCIEMADTAGYFTGNREVDEIWPWGAGGTAEQRFEQWTSSEYLDSFSARVPEPTLMGFHVCLGTWPTCPVASIDDISIPVKMANALVASCTHRVDFIQLPVLRDADRKFFAPLVDLRPGDAKVFLGLEWKDGEDALLARARAAREFLPDFGISHFCGYGRESTDVLPALMDDVRRGAEVLAAESAGPLQASAGR